MKPVAVLGGVCSLRAPDAAPLSLEELISSTVMAALVDAGLERADIDAVAIAASDQMDGRAISSMVTAGAAGAYLKEEIKSADEGIFALILAYMRVAAGLARTALAVSWSKCTEGDAISASRLETDPFLTRPLGINAVTAMALSSAHYAQRAGPIETALSAVVTGARRQGRRNPRCPQVESDTDGPSDESPLVAWPLRRAHLPREIDGCCALVLGDAALYPRRPVVRGLSWAVAPYSIGDRDGLYPLPHVLRDALSRAELASVHEASVVELADVSAYHYLMACEGMGLDVGRLPSSEGLPAVNPSGGLLAAHPGFASGLWRVDEVVRQLRGQAGPVQVHDARWGVVHAAWGLGPQGHAVVVLEGGSSS